MRPERPSCGVGRAFGLLLAGAFSSLALAAHAADRPVPDTYTATTTHLTPADLALKVDIVEWSDEAARSEAVSAIEAGEDALHALPTLGYLWLEGSGVGYAVKYAYREPTATGGERVTFVTDRRLGAYSFKPWTTDDGTIEERDYSVIELTLDPSGHGDGTFSLAADVSIDPDHAMVELSASPTRLLTNAMRQPKPYWAQPSG
jgi:hypothetical protein